MSVAAPPRSELRLGQLKDAGRLRFEQISAGKLNNVREALAIAREARATLGANGVSSEYPMMRHMANLGRCQPTKGRVRSTC